MLSRSRRRIDMGESASQEAHANPTDDPSFTAALARLDGLLQRAKDAAARQLEGLTRSRAAAAAAQAIQASARRTHLPHFGRVAVLAAAEKPELAPAIRRPRDVRTVRGFRTTAGAYVAMAQANQELMVKHGLALPVLNDLIALLERYDQTVALKLEARHLHVGATAELNSTADQIVQVVQVMDGYQRLRFAQDPDRLAKWESASSLGPDRRSSAPDGPVSGEAQQGAPQGSNTPSGGTPTTDVRPAA
jgi:hypothetical protein